MVINRELYCGFYNRLYCALYRVVYSGLYVGVYSGRLCIVRVSTPQCSQATQSVQTRTIAQSVHTRG
eukprot:1451179-Lingulodinium_polyedra.AAC.1